MTTLVGRLQLLSANQLSVHMVHNGIACADEWKDAEKKSWFEVVARFLAQFAQCNTSRRRTSAASKIVLHSMFCDESSAAMITLRVLCDIYKVRLNLFSRFRVSNNLYQTE
jgi:hypothetical protein